MDDRYFEIRNEFEKSLRVTIKIPHDEADRITINRLIRIRNANVSKNHDMSHFDKVLRFFLSDDEFQMYVIDEKEIEF